MFKTNEGTVDRALRVIVGIALLAAYFLYPLGTWGWVAALVGVIALVTGAVGTCPVYSLLGISTCPVKKA
ncbi:MAG: DUF2892 domain-containing protein [Phyllobacteriaceae bacterium]|nr:DUF2892 domain-containing protein [Phyllobacteriaceae bacterium]